jgi:tetratricopeptide (TPR) repeat protein
VAIYDRAIELADGDTTVGAGIIFACPYAFCHGAKGTSLCELGELEQARGLIEQGMAIARERGDIETVGWSHVWFALLAYVQGETEAALAHSQQAIDIAERIGGSFVRAYAWLTLGSAELMRGQWQQAIDAIERSMAIVRQGRTGVERNAWRLALLGEAHLGLGDVERARALVTEGIEIAHTRGHRPDEAYARLAQARVLLGTAGKAAHAEVETALARTLELARETDAKAFEPLVHVELGELARQLGDEEGSKRELREAHRLFTEISASGRAQRLRGEQAMPAS